MFGSFEIDMIWLIPKNARISSEFVAHSLPLCVAYRFLWSQIYFTSSFKFVVPSNISNGLALGMSNNMFASNVYFLALTNLDVRLHFNSATFFLKSQSRLPKKFVSSAPFKALQKWWKMLFYFNLKALFVLKIFKFLPRLFGHVENTTTLLERLC